MHNSSGPARAALPMVDLSVHDLTAIGVVDWLSASSPARRTIVGVNLHALYLFETDPTFKHVYEAATLRVADGSPVAKAARTPSGRRGVEKIGSTDWIALLHLARRDLRIAVIGASEASNAKAIVALRTRCPQHEVRGWNGYEAVAELAEADFEDLLSFAPDLVLLGLGMPRQEHWLTEHFQRLPDGCVYALVGGAIDQTSGAQQLAPQILRRCGLEWSWRLLLQPRRLAHRYLVEPLLLIRIVAQRRFRRVRT